MRTWAAVVGLTFAGATLPGLPAPGAAAAWTAVDPVAATRRQMVKGHGVRIVQHSTFNNNGEWERFKPTKGVIGFGDGKVVATDLVDHQVDDVRDICIGKRQWVYDPTKKRAEGKKWVALPVLLPYQCRLRLEVGYLQLDKPKVFAAVLATRTSERPSDRYDGVPTTLHEGVMTSRQLWDVRPELRPEQDDNEYAEWPVTWRLWIGQDGLVRRGWVKWRQPEGRLKGATGGQGWFGFVEDIRFSHWGMKVTIKPPPRSQTTAFKPSKDTGA
ncbi:hypothetical protein [Nonomuraea sp. NPDC052265]|uniref:hypothetical protein n=1 Tax=Nonomuraea sp. NPDC052265 TaxID=3364374 RepID=UPI0037CA9EB1